MCVPGNRVIFFQKSYAFVSAKSAGLWTMTILLIAQLGSFWIMKEVINSIPNFNVGVIVTNSRDFPPLQNKGRTGSRLLGFSSKGQ